MSDGVNLRTDERHAGAGAAAALLILLLTACSTPPTTVTPGGQSGTSSATKAAPLPLPGPPIQDPTAPRLQAMETLETPAGERDEGEGCARMGEGRNAAGAGRNGETSAAGRLSDEDTDALRLVFAAATDVSTARAYREDGGGKVFLCSGFSLRDDLSGAMSSVITVPSGSAIVTVAGAGGGWNPGENVVDFYGFASDEVAYVVVTTPDRREHLAAVQGHVWWAAPVVDEITASRAQEGSWRALGYDGTVIAEGTTNPRES